MIKFLCVCGDNEQEKEATKSTQSQNDENVILMSINFQVNCYFDHI